MICQSFDDEHGTGPKKGAKKPNQKRKKK